MATAARKGRQPAKPKTTTKKASTAKKTPKRKMRIFKHLNEKLGEKAEALVQLFDKEARDPETNQRRVLRYSENHVDTAWADAQEITEFHKAKTGWVKFTYNEEDGHVFLVQPDDTALNEFFDNTSFKGKVFVEIDREKEAEEFAEAMNNEMELMGRVLNLTIAEKRAIVCFLDSSYRDEEDFSDTLVVASLGRHIKNDLDAVAEALDSRETFAYYTVQRALHDGILERDGRYVKMDSQIIMEISLGTPTAEPLSKYMIKNQDLLNEIREKL